MTDVLVIGSMNMDLTVFTDRMPLRGETAAGRGFLLSPGGKGANQAVAAARMGARTAIIGCVGEDLFGEELTAKLRADGIDTEGVRRVPDVSTGVCSITVSAGDNYLIYCAGANAHVACEPREATRARVQACGAVLLQQEIPLETIVDALDIADQAGKPAFLTPAPAYRLPDSAYRKVRYLLPNETEASALLGRELSTDADMLGALGAFRRMGVAEPVITLGARGVACYVDSEPAILPGYRVTPVDTTGAGDTFTGALAAAILQGMPIREAADFAQRAAALCVTRAGAQDSIPTRAEVLQAALPRASGRDF